MNEIDKRRKDEFRRHEMEKKHKRNMAEKGFDEAKKKEAEEERRKLREKHLRDAQRVNHPVCETAGNNYIGLKLICLINMTLIWG